MQCAANCALFVFCLVGNVCARDCCKQHYLSTLTQSSGIYCLQFNFCSSAIRSSILLSLCCVDNACTRRKSKYWPYIEMNCSITSEWEWMEKNQATPKIPAKIATKYYAMMFASNYSTHTDSNTTRRHNAYGCHFFWSFSFVQAKMRANIIWQFCIERRRCVCCVCYLDIICMLNGCNGFTNSWHVVYIGATFFIQLQFRRCARPSIQILISVSLSLLAFIIFSHYVRGALSPAII